MKTITTSISAQPGAVDLTPRQRQLLAYFNKMSVAAQDFTIELAEQNARALPSWRPTLRVIVGGAA